MNEGQLVPVILWGKSAPYKIIDGYRRIAAISQLEWPSVRAIVRDDIDEEGAYRLSFIENVKRKNFSPLDLANAIWKMQTKGKSKEQLKGELNLSESQVNRYKALLDFFGPIKAALDYDKLTMALAMRTSQPRPTRPGPFPAAPRCCHPPRDLKAGKG
jgi:ParB/RepB/Spo0J family partition protein